MSIRSTWQTALAGYIHLGVAAACSILTVKLATQSLSQQEYGLWSLSFAVVGYLLFLDFGVSYSLGRIFARAFADQDGGELKQWILNCGVVLLLQGLVILLLGLLAEPILLSILKIPPELVPMFGDLWRIIIVSQAALFPFRLLNGLLHGADRVYQVHYANIGSTVLNLCLFWLFLRQDMGVRSFAWASLFSSLANAMALWVMVGAAGHLRGLAGCRLEKRKLKELFNFSWGIFIAGISAHLVTGGQAVVAARFLSVADVAVLNVTGRLPALAQQAVFALVDSFAPRWRTRYSQGLVAETSGEYCQALGAILRAGIVLIGAVSMVNPLFIFWWTRPEYFAGDLANLGLAALVFFRALNHSFQIPFVLSMRTHKMALIIFGGAVLEILAYIIGIQVFGIPGMLLGAVAINLALITPLLYRASQRELGPGKAHPFQTVWLAFPLALAASQGVAIGLRAFYQWNPGAALLVAFLLGGLALVPTLYGEAKNLRLILKET